MTVSQSSINTNISAYYAQQNIGKASSMASSSIARLSSGNRIVRASDDVAAMSAGTSLRTNVTTLRMALINTSQGSSLLQVADGALSQVTDILQRQKSIAVQAGSGSLTDQERTFLNQEFQNLTQETDRLAAQTNFNGVSLINGALSEKVKVADNQMAATAGTASIAFNVNVTAAQTLVLNGVTLTEGTNFTRGSSVSSTLDSLVTSLNSSTNVALSQATYSRSGDSLVITNKAGGSQSEAYTINANFTGGGTWTAAANAAVVNGKGASATINMFATNTIAAANIDSVVVNAAPTATQQFNVGTISVTATKLNGGVAKVIATTVAGMTLRQVNDAINANTATTGVSAKIVGSAGAYNIQLEHKQVDQTTAAGTGSQMTLTFGAVNNASVVTNAAASTTTNAIFSLGGGDDVGIGRGDTVGRGTIGNSIITGQTQTKAAVQLIFPDIAPSDLTNTGNFTSATPVAIAVGPATQRATFTFTTTGSGNSEIKIGATLQETLDNAAAKMNAYSGSQGENYNMNKIVVKRDGNQLVFESKDYGNALDQAGTALQVTYTNPVTGSSLTNTGNLNNGTTTGVTTSGVTNSAFTGKIGGFTASYASTTNSLTLSVKVGDKTYSGVVASTVPSANTTTRLVSQDGGGFFDIQLAANTGTSVASQGDANTYAQRINAAFESLTFYQNHTVSSYAGNSPILTNGVVTGSLIGSSMELQGTNFSSVSVDKARVTAPQGSNPNGSLVVTINGEDYTTSSNVGSTLGANSTVKLTSATDSNKFLTFKTGSTAIDFSNSDKAASFQASLQKAFGVGNGSAALQFQVGVTTTDTLKVSLGNVDTNTLFGGKKLDVLTQATAAAAAAAIDDAIDKVTSVRADVGALQSRFDFAAANVESSIQNQDAARGVLLDTDISAESTKFATAQVQMQAGIAVLAQANQMPQNLLKLIG